MRRFLLAVLLPGVLVSAVSTVSATGADESACCACIGELDAPQVLFCAEGNVDELQSRCDELNGQALKCFREPPDPELQGNSESQAPCGSRLVETGVNCPVTNGAPAASAPALGVLALACAAFGIWKVRRFDKGLEG